MRSRTTKQKLEGSAETTIANFLAARLGPLTHSGGTAQEGSLRFTVLHVRRRRPHMVLVEVV